MKLLGNIAKWLGIGVYAVCAVVIIAFLTPIGGWKALNVLTGSMKPTIQPGALVLIHHVPLNAIHTGDIITYQNPHDLRQTITHRVQKIGKVNGVTTLVVKGDANRRADPPFVGGLVVGRVAVIIPAAGQYIGWLHNAWGLAALVVIPGLLVIWAEIMILRRKLKETAPGSKAQPAPIVRDEPPSTPEPPAKPTAPAAVTPSSPTRPKRDMDGMRRMVVLALAALVLVVAGGAYAAASVGTVKLVHNKFTAVGNVPHTIADCLHGGWRNFGFKNQGQCVSFVVHQSHGGFPPIPTPHPPIPSISPIPTIPPIHLHPTPTPSPTKTPSPSPTPKHS
jgi:signal peptidase